MKKNNPAFKDEVDVVLEDLVEQCHGNIWHDFLAGLKSPALTTARKALDQAYQKKFLEIVGEDYPEATRFGRNHEINKYKAQLRAAIKNGGGDG